MGKKTTADAVLKQTAAMFREGWPTLPKGATDGQRITYLEDAVEHLRRQMAALRMAWMASADPQAPAIDPSTDERWTT